MNHRNHNTPFFYALLVTAKHRTTDPRRRYSIKHFVFRRGDKEFTKSSSRHVEIVDLPLVWPVSALRTPRAAPIQIRQVYRRGRTVPTTTTSSASFILHPASSPPRSSAFTGVARELLDGSRVQVLLEDSTGNAHKYSVAFRDTPTALRGVADELAQAQFASARAALIVTERSCNRALYRRAHDQETKSST